MAALSPVATRPEDFDLGLTLFDCHPALGAFESVLAPVALNQRVEPLVSADHVFGDVLGLRCVDLVTPEFDRLISR